MKALPPDFREPDFLRRQALALLAFDEPPPLPSATPAARLQRWIRLARAARAFPRHPRAPAWQAEAAQATPPSVASTEPPVSGSLTAALAQLQALVNLHPGGPAAGAPAARLAALAPQGLLWDPWTGEGRPALQAEGAGFHPGLALRLARLLLAATPSSAAGHEAALHQARELFAASLLRGWDRVHDGLHACIGVEDDAERLMQPVAHDAQNPAHDARFVVVDATRPTWVQAEGLSAAAALAARTLEGGYWDWYDRVWAFAWEHLRDAQLEGLWRPAPGVDPAQDVDGQAASAMFDACLDALVALEG